jgi:hypothetical protein
MTCTDNLPIIDFCNVKKGADFTQLLTFAIKNEETGVETIRDFSNVTSARLIIKEKIYSSSNLIELTLGSGLTLNTTNGTLLIKLTAAQTGALTVQSGVYDCFFTYADGSVEAVFEGKIIFRQGTI